MPRRVFLSERFHYTFGPHTPTLRIPPGQPLRVTCPDSDNALADGSLLRPDQRQPPPGTPLFEGNPMAGPIHVEGAQPGDCLAVHLEAITLDRATGQTLLAPAHGLLPDHLLRPPHHAEPIPRQMYRWRIDPDRNIAELDNPLGADPIRVPLDPFVGCIGTCPPWGQSISTLYGGDYGGNLDLPSIRPGSTLLLPVFHEGGLLMLGDLHAAQGHGEIIGGGIETSGQVDCTIHLLKGHAVPAPRVCSASHLLAVATAGSVGDAIQRAYARLLDWLADGLGLNRWDAYNLISQTAHVELGGISTPTQSDAAAVIPRAVLPARCNQEIDAWRKFDGP